MNWQPRFLRVARGRFDSPSLPVPIAKFPCRAAGSEPFVPQGYHSDGTRAAASAAAPRRRVRFGSRPLPTLPSPCPARRPRNLNCKSCAGGRFRGLTRQHSRCPRPRPGCCRAYSCPARPSASNSSCRSSRLSLRLPFNQRLEVGDLRATSFHGWRESIVPAGRRPLESGVVEPARTAVRLPIHRDGRAVLRPKTSEPVPISSTKSPRSPLVNRHGDTRDIIAARAREPDGGPRDVGRLGPSPRRDPGGHSLIKARNFFPGFFPELSFEPAG